MDKWRFLRKHENMTALSNIAWIEFPTTTIRISPIDTLIFISGMNSRDKQVLYRNTVGADGPKLTQASISHIDEILFDIANQLPVANIDVEDVARQADKIGEGDGGDYRYSPNKKSARLLALEAEGKGPDWLTIDWAIDKESSAEAVAAIAADADMDKLEKTPLKPVLPAKQRESKPAVAGRSSLKDELRELFAKSDRYTMDKLMYLTGKGESNLKTAMADLKNPKYSAGDVLTTKTEGQGLEKVYIRV